MREWQSSSLGDIAKKDGGLVDGPFGSNLPASDYRATGIPVIRGTNLSLGSERFKRGGYVYVAEETATRLKRSLCEPEDIIFTKKGTLGQTGFVPPSGDHSLFLLSSNQMRLRVDRSKADPLFVFYYVSSPASRDKIVRDSEATGVPKTNVTYLKTFPIHLPPLPKQHAIADILGSLDDKIESNRRTNETLEAVARALFKSWFVDFDPVHAKSKGRQPDGMDADTARLFPSSFVDSEIGRMPKGWRVGTVSEVAEINPWTLGKNDELDTIQYVEISEANHGDIGNIQVFDRGQEPSRARRRLRHGDTVLSTVRPDRGSYFLCLHPSPNLVASTGFAVLSPTKVPWSFMHAGITQADVFDHLGQHADGGAYPAVRPELIGEWQIALPSIHAVLDAFHRICSELFEQAANNRQQVALLSEIRNSLLPTLLSGDLKVEGMRS